MDKPITDINEARRILGSLMAGYEPSGKEGYYINKKNKSMIYPQKKKKAALELLRESLPKRAKSIKRSDLQ